MNPNRVIIILAFSVVTSFLGQGLVIPLLPIYARDLGASGLEIGLIFGSFSLTQMLFLPIVGRMSDKRGRKTFICLGLFAYFLTALAYMFADTIPALMITRMFQGACSGMIMPVAQAYAGELSPPGQEGKFQGILNIALLVGLAGGPFFGGLIKDVWGLNASFASLGVACFLGFCFCLIFLPPRKDEKAMLSHSPPVSFRVLASEINVIGVVLSRFALMICIGTIWMFMPLLTDELFGLSSSATGLLIALLVLMGAVSAPVSGYFSDRIDKRLITHTGLSLIAMAVGAIVLINNIWIFVALAILIGLANGIAMTSINAMGVVLGKKTHAMGSVMSIMLLGHGLAMFSGPIMSGILMDILSLKISLLICSIILVVSVLGFLCMTAGFGDLEKSVAE
jgi:MFS transporter, DHA1 family, multidrug resistance protein